jgi:hypothetical protein
MPVHTPMGPPVGNPMGVQNQGPPVGGPPTGNPMGAAEGQPNPEALAQRLMSLAQEAQQIIAQLEAMGINPEELLGGGGQPATPIPQMPVGGNTGGLGGGMPPGLLA